MNFFSIVSEFNPFHTGHKHLIEQTKAKTNTDAIVCIMSGSMVQRGDVAVYDKWTRAQSAIENGADLVVELPVCYVLQSADIFARGAVEIMSAMGSEGIAFGSECTDIELLENIAQIKAEEPDEYKTALAKALDTGMGYPAASEKALKEILGSLPDEITAPNATLGIAYLSAIKKINPSMKVHIEKREGDYHSTNLDGKFQSATAIRQIILSGDKNSTYSLCTSDEVYDINKISSYILGFFRTASPEGLEEIAGMEPGLAKRLTDKSKECVTFEEFVNSCTSKRYTLHRIRRVILCSILGIKEAPSPEYIRVLALSQKGAQILKDIKNKSKIEIITKITNSNQRNNPMLLQDITATDIAALCADKKASMDYTTTPIVTGKE